MSAVLLAAPAVGWAEASTASACVASCERHVTDKEDRTRICGRCLLTFQTRSDWVADLSQKRPFPRAQLTFALSDPDWQVARESAKALAQHDGVSVEAVLSTWLVGAKGQEKERACISAARIGADQKRSLADWQKRLSRAGGRDGRKAFTALARCEARIRSALEVEIYGLEPRASLEALRHLAALSGATPAEAVLDAMRTRPRDTDRIAADALLQDARSGGAAVGAALLEVATKENQERVNRLVALYAHDISQLAQKGRSVEQAQRLAILNDLALYGPLAAVELEPFVADEDAHVRLLAARTLARAEGRDFESAVRARVRPKPPDAPAAAEVQIRWLRLYGESGRASCAGGVVAEVAEDERAPPTVRAAALEAYGGCAGIRAHKTVARALRSPSEEVRAGAVRALVQMPRSQEAKKAAAQALQDPSPRVQAEALNAVAAQMQNPEAARVAALVSSPDAKVRAAAVHALGALGANAHTVLVADCLKNDADREVRLSAVDALAAFGGPVAMAALSDAAKNDPESRVRHVADGWLRKLGFGGPGVR